MTNWKTCVENTILIGSEVMVVSTYPGFDDYCFTRFLGQIGTVEEVCVQPEVDKERQGEYKIAFEDGVQLFFGTELKLV